MRRAAIVALAVLFVAVAALVGVRSFADAAPTSDCATVADCISHAQADLTRAAGFSATMTTSTTTTSTTLAPTTTTVAVTGCTPNRRLTQTNVLPYLYAAGFTTRDQLGAMEAIAIAESSLNTAARNWHSEYGIEPADRPVCVVHVPQYQADRGTWQISSHSWPQYPDVCTDDPACAARAAHDVYGVQGLSAWDPWKAGTAQKYLTAAVNGWLPVYPFVDAFLASL